MSPWGVMKDEWNSLCNRIYLFFIPLHYIIVRSMVEGRWRYFFPSENKYFDPFPLQQFFLISMLIVLVLAIKSPPWHECIGIMHRPDTMVVTNHSLGRYLRRMSGKNPYKRNNIDPAFSGVNNFNNVNWSCLVQTLVIIQW